MEANLNKSALLKKNKKICFIRQAFDGKMSRSLMARYTPQATIQLNQLIGIKDTLLQRAETNTAARYDEKEWRP